MSVKSGWLTFLALLVSAVIGIGCQSSTTSNPQAGTGDESAEAADEDSELIAASIADPSLDEDEPEDETEDDDGPAAEPAEGTPEWYVREIIRVRLKPFPSSPQTADGQAAEAGSTSDADPDAAAEQLARLRRERNQEVIELAKQAIALTHKDPAKEVSFNAAVHHLLDARLQLALAGEQEDVDALYEVADALEQSKPHSEAAAAAALTIVNFAHANAVRYAQSEPRWIQEFSRQAQMFAGRISEGLSKLESPTPTEGNPRMAQLQKDASRAAQILMAAAQSCEAAGFMDDAQACYSLIKSKFPDSPQAPYSAGVLRRMHLKGQPLQLAGPTLDGSFLSIEDFKGKTVVVVFWASEAKPFLDQLPALAQLQKKYSKYAAVVGVCLDTDEFQLDNFLAEHALSWPQVFYSEPEKRGWNSPPANYYGISSLPTIWIVDAAGVVAETDVAGADLEPKLREVVRKSMTNKSGGTKIQPAAGVSQEK